MRAYEFLIEARMKPTGNDSPQAWIDYFLTSEHPSLKGQDPETLKRMALAARSKAVHNPPKPKPAFKPRPQNPNTRYWWQEKDESVGEEYDEEKYLTPAQKEWRKGKVPIKLKYYPHTWLENTPNGVLVHGSAEGGYADQDGGEANGEFEFVGNLSTNEVDLDFKDYDDHYNSYADPESMRDIAHDCMDDVRKEYGETWEEIEQELYGGLSVDQD